MVVYGGRKGRAVECDGARELFRGRNRDGMVSLLLSHVLYSTRPQVLLIDASGATLRRGTRRRIFRPACIPRLG